MGSRALRTNFAALTVGIRGSGKSPKGEVGVVFLRGVLEDRAEVGLVAVGVGAALQGAGAEAEIEGRSGARSVRVARLIVGTAP